MDDFDDIDRGRAFLAEIMGEVERAIVKIHGDDVRPKAEKAVRDMARAFPEAVVTDYAALEAAFEGAPDPKDRHVMAAAVACHASIIVTDNLGAGARFINADVETTVLRPEEVGNASFTNDAGWVDALVAAKLEQQLGKDWTGTLFPNRTRDR